MLLRNGGQTVYSARDQEILYYEQSFFYHIVSMVVKIELEVRMAVKIVRVLNTNAVVGVVMGREELIITGAGIGFKKKKGENLMKHWRIKLIIWRVSMTAGDCRK